MPGKIVSDDYHTWPQEELISMLERVSKQKLDDERAHGERVRELNDVIGDQGRELDRIRGALMSHERAIAACRAYLVLEEYDQPKYPPPQPPDWVSYESPPEPRPVNSSGMMLEHILKILEGHLS